MNTISIGLSSIIPAIILFLKYVASNNIFNESILNTHKSILPLFFYKKIVTKNTISYDLIFLSLTIFLIGLGSFLDHKTGTSTLIQGFSNSGIIFLQIAVVVLLTVAIILLLKNNYNSGTQKEIEFKNSEISKYALKKPSQQRNGVDYYIFKPELVHNRRLKRGLKYHFINLSCLGLSLGLLFFNLAYLDLIQYAISIAKK